MAMLPNTNMARGSSWGGFGYNTPNGGAPPTVGPAGLGAPQMGMSRPQMMGNALMANQMGTVPQQPFGAAGTASPWGGTFGTPQQGVGQAVPNMAQPAQAQPAMQRPMPVPRGYAR